MKGLPIKLLKPKRIKVSKLTGKMIQRYFKLLSIININIEPMIKSIKTYLLLFAVFLLRTACAGQSLNPNDTICISVADAQNCAIAKKQRTVLQERIGLLNDEITLLNKRIAEKQGAIDDYITKDTAHIREVGTYQKEIAVKEEQKKTMQAEIDRINKELKKEKHKRFWTSVGGVAGIGIMGYLYITK